MFNFEREFSAEGTSGIAERHQAERPLQERQRDVYDTHKHRTYAVAYYMTGSEVEAEEVLEGTFVRAFHTADEPDGCGVDTAMVSELRERLPMDEVASPADACAGESLGGQNVKRTELEEAVQELPANERIVFLLRDVEGYDAQHVAELLKVPRAQVERTALSARIRIRQFLAARSIQAAAA